MSQGEAHDSVDASGFGLWRLLGFVILAVVYALAYLVGPLDGPVLALLAFLGIAWTVFVVRRYRL